MGMESNEMQKIVDKVEFYRANEIKCHVLTVPRPTFKNGLFVSELQNNKFFWFIELDTAMPIRLFLSEIYEIYDYKEEGKDDN